jgi:hypothetical protein
LELGVKGVAGGTREEGTVAAERFHKVVITHIQFLGKVGEFDGKWL